MAFRGLKMAGRVPNMAPQGPKSKPMQKQRKIIQTTEVEGAPHPEPPLKSQVTESLGLSKSAIFQKNMRLAKAL